MKLSRAYLDEIFEVRPVVKKTPCSVAKNQKSWHIDGAEMVVKANTKSEARAAIKGLIGRSLGCRVPRLPVGVNVEAIK